jgi:pyruvate dehydrogenase E2 component (dihydrolipoamide acetyltransferase)
MSAVRKTIADRMTRSWREIPHVTTFGEALAQPLLTARDELGKPPLEALIITRVLPLLADHPLFNAVVDGTDIVERGFYDIGFAVNAPQGLLVAVVHDADQKSVDEIGSEVVRLADAARSRRLSPDDASGQTFTVSNIGAVGGRFGTPIIPLGTSAILSVGRADPQPVVDDGEIVAARVFPLSLSYDHRLIDGAEGRSFMADLIETLERP